MIQLSEKNLISVIKNSKKTSFVQSARNRMISKIQKCSNKLALWQSLLYKKKQKNMLNLSIFHQNFIKKSE